MKDTYPQKGDCAFDIVTKKQEKVRSNDGITIIVSQQNREVGEGEFDPSEFKKRFIRPRPGEEWD